MNAIVRRILFGQQPPSRDNYTADLAAMAKSGRKLWAKALTGHPVPEHEMLTAGFKAAIENIAIYHLIDQLTKDFNDDMKAWRSQCRE